MEKVDVEWGRSWEKRDQKDKIEMGTEVRTSWPECFVRRMRKAEDDGDDNDGADDEGQQRWGYLMKDLEGKRGGGPAGCAELWKQLLIMYVSRLRGVRIAGRLMERLGES